MTLTETIELGATELMPLPEEHLSPILRAEFIATRFNVTGIAERSETGDRSIGSADETATFDETSSLTVPIGIFHTIEDLIAVARLFIGDPTADRVIFLRAEERNLEPGERAMSGASLRHFLEFLLHNEKQRNCLIGVAPSGNLNAEWHTGDDRHAVIEFLPSGSVRYAAICPNPDDVSTPKSVSGTVPLSDIFEALAPYEFAERAA